MDRRKTEAVIVAAGDLETVLADARQRAQVLRAEGHPIQAATIERVCDDVQRVMASYLTLLTDSQAMLRSGWRLPRLRDKFPEWKATKFAYEDEHGRRLYRECIVPVRADASADKLAGARGEPLQRASGE